MIEIIFQSKEDAGRLKKFLQRALTPINVEHQQLLLIEDKNRAKLRINTNFDYHLKAIKHAFYQYILEIKQEDWFRRILMEQYHFYQEDEQEQILEIIQSVVEGNRNELQSFVESFREENDCILQEAIHDVFQMDVSFSFDSFVRFRLRPFLDRLEKYVEISIDEYKMEQEYQMFIHTLREFLSQQESKVANLHLLIDEGISFFDSHFYEIKRAELTRMIDRRLISNHPVYIDSLTIAPLLSIAPREIYIYTNDMEQPLIRTIRNIFEERVFVKSISTFFESKGLHALTAEEKI